jgi:hypothetical protein
MYQVQLAWWWHGAHNLGCQALLGHMQQGAVTLAPGCWVLCSMFHGSRVLGSCSLLVAARAMSVLAVSAAQRSLLSSSGGPGVGHSSCGGKLKHPVEQRSLAIAHGVMSC